MSAYFAFVSALLCSVRAILPPSDKEHAILSAWLARQLARPE